jgi:hypothetical protein
VTELDAVLAAARELAWHSHANMYGPPYAARRQAFAQLRGALHVYDQEAGRPADLGRLPTRPGAEPRAPEVAA